MTDCLWTWEYSGGALSVHVCAREDSMAAKFVRGEDAVALEVPYVSIEELKKKFAEALAALFMKRN